MIGLECLHATAEISERSDVIRAFPKRSKSSCNFARSAKGLTGKSCLTSITGNLSVTYLLGDVLHPAVQGGANAIARGGQQSIPGDSERVVL